MIDINYFEHKYGYKIIRMEELDLLQDHELYIGMKAVKPDNTIHQWDGEKWVNNVP